MTVEDVAEIEDSAELRFDFITPLPGLAAILSGSAPNNLNDSGGDGRAGIAFPDLSVSMPGEDLALGNEG